MHTFDMDAYLRAYPEQAKRCVERIAEIVRTCETQLAQLPVTIRSIEQVSAASVVSLTSTTIGTTVFEVQDNSTVPIIRPDIDEYRLDSDATFVIAGGLGDLGQKLFVKMAEHGAKHLVSLSRREAKTGSLQQLISGISPDCKVYHIQCDISQNADVEAAVAQITSLGCPPVRGVIQSAHTLQVHYYSTSVSISFILITT
jgi:FlaA1/EpsC-like NDP-sugar epimerase